MFAHDRLDRLSGFVSVIEGDGADVVVKHVGFDDAVEKVGSDWPKVAVDSCSCTASEVPCFRLVVRKGRIGMLKVRDGN